MLPWIFAVLVLVNAGLFLWGYQREKSLAPPPTPVPQGRYEIRLPGEAQEQPQQAAAEPNDAGRETKTPSQEALAPIRPAEEVADAPTPVAGESPVLTEPADTADSGIGDTPPKGAAAVAPETDENTDATNASPPQPEPAESGASIDGTSPARTERHTPERTPEQKATDRASASESNSGSIDTDGETKIAQPSVGAPGQRQNAAAPNPGERDEEGPETATEGPTWVPPQSPGTDENRATTDSQSTDTR